MIQILVVGAGGFLGAVLRYWLSGSVQRWTGGAFPAGTLVVNLLGCLALGAMMCLVEYRQPFGPNVRLFITVGILGALTTFSTFGYETFALLRDHELLPAVLNVLANVVVGIGAVLLGWFAVKSMAM
jgi:CrcB protein